MEQLVYDRTEQDLINNTLKGQHNTNDLNRIEAWCKYLSELLTEYGYKVDIATKTDWKISDERYDEELERIRANIQLIKESFFAFQSTPEAPNTLNRIDIQKANDIEKILSDIEQLIKGMELIFVKSEVANCGQNRLWQQRFRRPKTWESCYKINQYSPSDTVRNLMSSNSTYEGEKTSLGLAILNSRDDVGGSIVALNSSFDILKNLIGEVVINA